MFVLLHSLTQTLNIVNIMLKLHSYFNAYLYMKYSNKYLFVPAPADLVNSPGQGGCPTPGCNGIGHIKGAKYTGHHRSVGRQGRGYRGGESSSLGQGMALYSRYSRRLA